MKVYGFEEPSEVSGGRIIQVEINENSIEPFDFAGKQFKSEIYIQEIMDDNMRWFTCMKECRSAFRKECNRLIEVYKNLKRQISNGPLHKKIEDFK